MERWKSIVGWEGWYEVSNYGRVRRIARGKGARSGYNILTVSHGYPCVGLNRPGVQQLRRVRTLVLTAFDRPKRDGEECRHIHGNPLDSRLENRCGWSTRRR
ncbi:MAG: hypothetical protein LLG00_09185 [Planctomycetaceae bacterium]|nr:hypothetical protein [Planctomycetaceae bacterium]